VSARFSDYEQLAEATCGWDLNFRQLDAGQSPSELIQLATPEMNVLRLRLSRQYDQLGRSPVGTRTVALIEEGVRGARWCGREVLPSTLQTFRAGGDFEAASLPGFEVYTVSLSEDRLAEAARSLGVPELDDCVGSAEHQSADAHRVAALRRELRTLFCDLESGALASPSWVGERLSELPERLMLAVASPSPSDLPASLPVRERARRIATDWIEDHLEAAPKVADLCAAVGVSRRTLEYAFREHFGVSPKAYLTARRLVAVRGRLLRADPAERVVDVANELGFWHMGDFAAAYRRHFGELPSQTLCR
jgi:AraC family ethanolamine operon transcriptional activator